MTAFDKQRLSKLLLELHAFLKVQKERSECIIDRLLGPSAVCGFLYLQFILHFNSFEKLRVALYALVTKR